MSTIPASQLVAVNPSVLPAGGTAIATTGLVLTNGTRAPIGQVLSFPDGESVTDYFGAASAEDIVANGATGKGTGYFGGFTGAPQIPGAILFAQYNEDAVAAWLRGGDVSGLTLAQVQAISGTLSVVMDGNTFAAGALDLSSATSFSSAAGLIETALAASAPSGASVTGSIGGSTTASAGATFTGTGSGTNLTAASVSGVIHVGAQISGTGVPAGTYIVSQTSGSAGGAGVYVTNHATTSSGDAITAVSNQLDVTVLGSGTLQVGDVLAGTGVASGTAILSQLSGTPNGVGIYIIDSAQQFDSTTVASSSTVLNVTAVGSGSLEIGAALSGTNVTADTIITANLTGSGGTGTYRVSEASTTISETITSTATPPDVTYDSISGAFVVTSGITGALSSAAYATGTTSTALKLTSATGAVLSQGAAAASPDTFMDALVAVNRNWVSFMTAFDPDDSGFAVKQEFASWNESQNNRYVYVCWDTDTGPTTQSPDTGCLAYALEQAGDSGTALIWEGSDLNHAAFLCGAIASIDFNQTNGRVSFAYKTQSGLMAAVTDPTVAVNLGGLPNSTNRGNGYNFVGAYGTATDDFTWLQRSFVTGDFAWLDSYVNQIWLNYSFQSALLSLLQNALSIPYGTAGNGMIEAALADPIQAGLNFGAFGPGVLSASQISQVNAQAGTNIATALQTQGYYLQIQTASAATRAARTSPTMKFWYIDNGSVQALDLDSISLQ